MKTAIHPTYHEKVKVTCACGNTFETGSTSEALSIEICSNCHPFYTGKQKLVDTAKRVDKFQARTEKAVKLAKPRKTKKEKNIERKAKKKAKIEKEEEA